MLTKCNVYFKLIKIKAYLIYSDIDFTITEHVNVLDFTIEWHKVRLGTVTIFKEYLLKRFFKLSWPKQYWLLADLLDLTELVHSDPQNGRYTKTVNSRERCESQFTIRCNDFIYENFMIGRGQKDNILYVIICVVLSRFLQHRLTMYQLSTISTAQTFN